MVKIKILVTLLIVCFLSTSIVGEPKEADHNLDGIEQQIQYLMEKHNDFMKKPHNLFTEFEREFFSNFQFLDTPRTKSFFSQIRTENPGEDNFYRITIVSHTKTTLMNGKFHTVNYTYESDGKNIRFTKYTNNNGDILKGVYYFDTKGNRLRTTEFKNRSMLQSKLYHI